MHAHKLHVNVDPSHRLAIDLPPDFPPGPAEVIVLAESRTSRAATPAEPHAADDIEAEFARLFPRDPLLARVVFHEDPAAPLASEDWPEAFDDEAPP